MGNDERFEDDDFIWEFREPVNDDPNSGGWELVPNPEKWDRAE